SGGDKSRKEKKPREKRAAQWASPPLHGRSPAMIKTHEHTPANVDHSSMGRQLQVELEEALQGLDALGVVRIRGNGTASLATQRHAWQLLRCRWHGTPEHCRDGLSATLSQPHCNAVRTLLYQINIVLCDHDPRRQHGEVKHIA